MAAHTETTGMLPAGTNIHTMKVLEVGNDTPDEAFSGYMSKFCPHELLFGSDPDDAAMIFASDQPRFCAKVWTTRASTNEELRNRVFILYSGKTKNAMKVHTQFFFGKQHANTWSDAKSSDFISSHPDTVLQNVVYEDHTKSKILFQELIFTKLLFKGIIDGTKCLEYNDIIDIENGMELGRAKRTRSECSSDDDSDEDSDDDGSKRLRISEGAPTGIYYINNFDGKAAEPVELAPLDAGDFDKGMICFDPDDEIHTLFSGASHHYLTPLRVSADGKTISHMNNTQVLETLQAMGFDHKGTNNVRVTRLQLIHILRKYVGSPFLISDSSFDVVMMLPKLTFDLYGNAVEQKANSIILSWIYNQNLKPMSRKLSANTEVTVTRDDGVYILLHGNKIISVFNRNGKLKLELSACGWHTRTTKSRINSILYSLFKASLLQRAYQLKISKGVLTEVITNTSFEEGKYTLQMQTIKNEVLIANPKEGEKLKRSPSLYLSDAQAGRLCRSEIYWLNA